tara:strand:- start:233 stop:1126 length:894 start_codon:yes stop_codon:yes gene_type:complete
MKIVVPQTNFIVNHKYADICDIKYSYSYYEKGNTWQIFQLNDEQFFEEVSKISSNTISVYCKRNHITHLFGLLRQINKKVILFTGCSDEEVNQNDFSHKPENVIKWFAENVNYEHENLIPTPIGSLVGSWIGNEDIDPILCGHPDFVKIFVDDKEKENKNLMLMAFSLNTNYSSRSEVYKYFKDESYVTNLCSEDNSKKVLSEEEFCQEIYNHKFVFSPEGNGIDCGRTWVTIQLGSIPIVKRSILTEYVEDKLPIFVYDSLDEITEESLKNFKPKCMKHDLIDINYYRKLVKYLKD